MIVTVTPNPSIDRTVELGSPLRPGQVQRARGGHDYAGGKGVNVARVLRASGVDYTAIMPTGTDDPLLSLLFAAGLSVSVVPISQNVRVNVTVTDPEGITTKINAPGPELLDHEVQAVRRAIVTHSKGARWLTLNGSLPPGVDEDFFAEVIADVREAWPDGPRIAVDASGAPLVEAVLRRPDLIKPNAEELAELVTELRLAEKYGIDVSDPDDLETRPEDVAVLTRALVERGVGMVVATIGGQGAILSTPEGTWHALHEPVEVRSTVGAGDSALAGFLCSDERGLDHVEALRHSVALGTLAASLPGTQMPDFDGGEPERVSVVRLDQETAG